MSTEKVTISRILVIDSPIHLWKLLKNKEEILSQNSHLNIFCYHVDKYLDGCRCDDEKNKELVNSEYIIIKNTDSLVDFIKSEFRATSVTFLQNDW